MGIEHVALIEEGLIRCSRAGSERRQPRSVRCRCGWEISVKLRANRRRGRADGLDLFVTWARIRTSPSRGLGAPNVIAHR